MYQLISGSVTVVIVWVISIVAFFFVRLINYYMPGERDRDSIRQGERVLERVCFCFAVDKLSN